MTPRRQEDAEKRIITTDERPMNADKKTQELVFWAFPWRLGVMAVNSLSPRPSEFGLIPPKERVYSLSV
jgi:hypothetical protein